MKRVEDRGGTQIATKVEGGTSVFPVGARMVPDLNTAMPPTQGVTVTGPGNFNTRILSHNLAVYRGDGATLTPAHGPAPPAHAAQPSSVIHQIPGNPVKTETISLSSAAVSLQYSRSPNTGNSITVAAVTSPSLHNLQLAPAPQIVQKPGSGPHGAPVFGGATAVRTVTPAQNIPTSGNPSFQRLKVEDALSYLDQVKFKFGSQPQVYNDFLDIMKEFKSQSIDTPGVISRVSTLFRGHPELIVGFNTFLPPGYKIEVQTSESQHNLPGGHPHNLQSPLFQTIVHTPHGIHMMGSQGIIGPAITSTTGGLPTINQIPRTSHHTPKYQLKTEPTSLPTVVTVPAPNRNNDNTVYAAVQPPSAVTPVIAAASLTPSIIPTTLGVSGGGPMLPLQPSQLGPPITQAASNVVAAAVANASPHHPNSNSSIGPNTGGGVLPPTVTPPHQPPSVGGGGGGANQQQPVEFNHAINYVNKIKNRFQGQPDVYKQFLEILHTYQKDQRAIKDGGTPKSLLTETEVYSQVSRLFQNQDDLLAEFSQFLPEATNDNGPEALQFSNKPISMNDTTNNKRSTPKPVIPPSATGSLSSVGSGKPSIGLPTAGGDRASQPPSIGSGGGIGSLPPGSGQIGGGLINSSVNNDQKRPMQPNSRMQPPTKKPRLGVLKDVSLAEAGKFGTLNEYAFFDKVRKTLNSAEVYENFLRCLVLFNQEVVSRAELVQLVNPFLNKNPELLKWFKDFVGFKDGAKEPVGFAPPIVPELSGPPAAGPPPMHQPRHERMPGDTAMEIDYASCKRLGASYCALPKNFVQPKCTGRGTGNTLCREVLNDTWVSFPSWSEDSQFVSSRKTQYEENIYRTEDERFEFDVVLETNRDTIKVLECVQKKMSRMPPEEAARYRLDDCLGGTSPTIHQRAVRRIYGDKAADIIDGLKRNPVVAVPLVLRRLKAKDAEWRDVQKQFNKIWREQNEKYYLKSLDHQGIIFKQNDVRFIRSKSLLNEIETLYDEAHEAEEQSGQPSAGPHITLHYKDKAMLEDASQLLIHHVKRQTGIHKEDKQKIKTFLRQTLPDIFFHTRLEMSEEEDDSYSEEQDQNSGDEQDKEIKDLEKETRNKERNKVQDIQVKDEEIEQELKENKAPPFVKGLPPGEEYTMLMGNNNLYLFIRLHSILTERLGKIYDQAVIIAAEEGDSNQDKKESTAAALRLKPKNGLSPTDYYPAFLDLVRSLLDGNMENQAYEDTLREMFGIHAFTAFTLDKVIGNAVRQLQQIATDDTCQDCMELFNNERKTGGTGGQVSLAEERYYSELMYQKKSEKLLTDENCFKMIFCRESGSVTIELLDTDSETREGSEEGDDMDQGGSTTHEDKAQAFLTNFLGMKISEEARQHFNLKPVFLRRSVRQYRKRNRHKLVPRPDKHKDRTEANEDSTNKESTDSTLDPAAAPSGDSGRPGKTGGTPAVSRLGLDDESIMMEKSACALSEDRLRIVWVVNSENYIYKRNSLNRARQTHPDVCTYKYRKFNTWHSEWASKNVAAAAGNHTADWFMGRTEGLSANQTTKVTVNADVKKIPPYRTFYKFKAEMLKGP